MIGNCACNLIYFRAKFISFFKSFNAKLSIIKYFEELIFWNISFLQEPIIQSGRGFELS